MPGNSFCSDGLNCSDNDNNNELSNRCETFNIITEVNIHIETITKGIKDVIIPRLEGVDKDTVEDFILGKYKLIFSL